MRQKYRDRIVLFSEMSFENIFTNSIEYLKTPENINLLVDANDLVDYNLSTPK
jgi:hypothetical protein